MEPATTDRLRASKPRLDSLTGLRFFAAFLVLGFHSDWAKLPGLPQALRNLTLQANFSVSLFYVLSGFILTFTYVSAAPSPCPSPAALPPRGEGMVWIDERRFWSARVARIYPVYLFALLVALPFFVLDTLQQPPEHLQGRILGGILVLTLLQSWVPRALFLWNYPAWSLSNEAFFYFLFPRGVPWIHRLSENALLAAVGVLWLLSQVPLVLYLALGGQPFETTNAALIISGNPLFRLPEFLIGMMVGMLFLRRIASAAADPPLHALATARRASVLSTFAALAIVGLLLVREDWPEFMKVSQNIFAPLFGVLIFALAVGGGPVARILARPSIVLLGEASYSLYILHVPIINWLEMLVPESIKSQPWTYWTLTCVTCVLVSVLTYKLLEKPAHEYLRKKIPEWLEKRHPI